MGGYGGGSVPDPIKLANGSAADPAYSFSGDDDTGMYLYGSNELGFTTGGGAARMRISSSAITITPTMVGTIFRGNGGNSTNVVFNPDSGDTNTGIYGPAADELGFSTGGTERLLIAGVNDDVGFHFTQPTNTSGSRKGWVFQGAPSTAQTASTETIDVDFDLDATLQHATGAIAVQRSIVMRPRAYSFVGASTIAQAATLAIEGAPTAGTNATITNAYAFWVQGGTSRFVGPISAGPTGGTDPASTGEIRLTNGASIVWRDPSNTGDLTAITVDISGVLLLGTGDMSVQIANAGGSSLGFFATAPTTLQTVTGSRGGNAALQSLLSALAAYGLIVDSTS